MTALQLNGTPVDDDYSETFTARMAAVWITAPTRELAREAAYETKGLGRSATMPPCEATIARELSPEHTPDGRPGFELHLFERKTKHLRECLALRLRKGTMPYPGTAVFNGMPSERTAATSPDDVIDLHGTVVQRFADGFGGETQHEGRTLLQIPRMDGVMSVERRYPTVATVTGGMFLLFGADRDVLEAALACTKAAGATRPLTTAKCAASGSKVGALNETDMVATTNHRYCPSLREAGRVDDSKLPDGIGCVYEVIVSGPSDDDVRAAMAAGLVEAARHESVRQLSTANYGGKLGSGQIALRELIGSSDVT